MWYRAIIPLMLWLLCHHHSSAIRTNGQGLKVEVTSPGTYSVSINGAVWMSSSPVRVHINGQWLSTCDGTLVACTNGTTQHYRGTSATHGPWNDVQWRWASHTTPERCVLQTSIRSFAEQEFVVFEQRWLQTTLNTATVKDYGVRGNSKPARDVPISAFPSFNTSRGLLGLGKLGFISWDDSNEPMQAMGANGIGTGIFGSGPNQRSHLFQGGLFGGGIMSFSLPSQSTGPSTTLVMSQFSDFFAGTISHLEEHQELRCGLLGGTAQVPAGLTLRVLMSCARGVNFAYRRHGDILLREFGKTRVKPNASHVLRQLGYSTTAFYFYHTLGVGYDYADTILTVAKSALLQQLPFGYYLVDSWWYGEDCFGGVDRWDESAAREVDCWMHTPHGRFPTGLGGLSAALQQLGSGDTFVLHLGKWIQNSTYARNTSFDFYVHRNDSDPMWGGSLSISPVFWNWLIGHAVQNGLSTLKQDHVDNQIGVTPPCWQRPGFTMAWLGALDAALLKHGATLTAGGYTHRGWLPSLTHARVAPDYYGWRNESMVTNNGDYWNWAVGPHALLSWAVGLWSYKDSFYSTTSEVNNDPRGEHKFQGFHEPYPWSQALASALSGGPIAPGDGFNGSNVSLIMSTCRSDGLLLKPDRPAVAVDSYWLSKMFDPGATLPMNHPPVPHEHVIGRDGQLWVTSTTLAGKYTWAFVASFGLEVPATMAVDELEANVMAWLDETSEPAGALWHVACEWRECGKGIVRPFSSSAPLFFDEGPDYGTVTYYMVPPTLANGCVFLGEPSKLIPVSIQRFPHLDVTAGSDEFSVYVDGGEGEHVQIFFLDAHGAQHNHTVVFTREGTKKVTLPVQG